MEHLNHYFMSLRGIGIPKNNIFLALCALNVGFEKCSHRLSVPGTTVRKITLYVQSATTSIGMSVVEFPQPPLVSRISQNYTTSIRFSD